jgi:hypothetical protein
MTRWVRRSLYTGGFSFRPLSTAGESEAPAPSHGPFFRVEPISVFGSLSTDDAYESSRVLAIPSTLAPIRLDASRPAVSSRVRQQS